MLQSIDLVQFHADKILASASYFRCCCCWSFSIHCILCCCQLFLFRLRVLLFRKLFFFYFPWSIPIFIDWSSIIFVICFRHFCCVYFVFLVTLTTSFSSRQFHELSRLFCAKLEIITPLRIDSAISLPFINSLWIFKTRCSFTLVNVVVCRSGPVPCG